MDLSLILAATGEPGTWETVQSYAWMILSVGAGLGFVIFVHELGHFLVAKACGVKCEKFYVGFDIPLGRFVNWLMGRDGEFKLFGIGIPKTIGPPIRWGETEYGIGILPLGGYVKMLGQDDDPRQAAAEMDRCKVPSGSADDAPAEGTSAEQPQYELDPRSYVAKPVWARMAIISAGVTMNVIFGALLAAFAYGLGVPEMPAIIGPTIPGSPAWKIDLEPGSQVMAFGTGPRYDHYRFEDVKRRVVFSGENQDLTLTVQTPDGEERTITVKPELRDEKKSDLPTIGFKPPTEPKLGISNEIPPHLRPSTDVALEDQDRIVAIQGVKLREGNAYDPRLDAILAQNPTGPLELTIQRRLEQTDKKAPPKYETLDVVVQPRPIREVGLAMKIGPVVAIRAGSPAEKAGFQINDVILKVNGQDVGNPLSLGQRLLPPTGSDETYSFLVARKGADGKVTEETLTVRPEPPRQSIQDYPFGGPIAIESVGVACAVTAEIASLEQGSPAAKADLQPGDRIVAARVAPAGAEQLEKEQKFNGKEFTKEIVLDDDVNSWTLIHSMLQDALPDTALALKVQRGKKVFETTLLPVDSAKFFDERRALTFYLLRVEHKADSVGEAFYLGTREVKERMVEVLATISQLVQKPKFAKHLSGPAGIMAAAGQFASEGLPTLLIFLTILSANLAILNFLPIPVLDGGHMLFLAWEGVTRKPVNPHVQGWLSLGGLAFLLGLMLFATAMDFNRFFS